MNEASMREVMGQAAWLTDKEWEAFRSLLFSRTFKRNEYLLMAGQQEAYLSFIVSGICRDFVDRSGKEYTLGFSFPGSFTGGYASFVSGSPSRIFVQALSDVEVLSMPKERLSELYGISKNGERIGRISAEMLYVQKENREIDLLTLSAYERYEKLVNEQPELLREIPQKLLAEYLGMTPENFSRMKRAFYEEQKNR